MSENRQSEQRQSRLVPAPENLQPVEVEVTKNGAPVEDVAAPGTKAFDLEVEGKAVVDGDDQKELPQNRFGQRVPVAPPATDQAIAPPADSSPAATPLDGGIING